MVSNVTCTLMEDVAVQSNSFLFPRKNQYEAAELQLHGKFRADGPWSYRPIDTKTVYLWRSENCVRFGLIILIKKYVYSVKINAKKDILLLNHPSIYLPQTFSKHPNRPWKVKYDKFTSESRAAILPVNKPRHFN